MAPVMEPGSLDLDLGCRGIHGAILLRLSLSVPGLDSSGDP